MARLATVAVLLLTLGTAETFAAPAISVDDPFYETSIPAAGVVVHHAFTVTNAGDQTLRITDAKPSCVCTTASPAKAELEPGKSIAITVAVYTTGQPGKPSNCSRNPRPC